MVPKAAVIIACWLGQCAAIAEDNKFDDIHDRYYRQQVYCLASNIFHEARGEPLESQIIVGLITVARVRDSGTSVCREVYRWNQFSWANNVNGKLEQRKGKEWIVAYSVASDVYNGKYELDPKLSCIRYYKRTDDVGVTENGKKFFSKLDKKVEFGMHSGYCKKQNGVKRNADTSR
jgi:hypothetical protein